MCYRLLLYVSTRERMGRPMFRGKLFVTMAVAAIIVVDVCNPTRIQFILLY